MDMQQARPSPEQLKQIMRNVAAETNLIEVWRKKTARHVVDMLDRYMKARAKMFNYTGPYLIADVLKFVCAVSGTVLAHICQSMQTDPSTLDDHLTEMRVLFDSWLDDYLKVLRMPMLTTEAVTILLARREAEQKEVEADRAEREAAKTAEPQAEPPPVTEPDTIPPSDEPAN